LGSNHSDVQALHPLLDVLFPFCLEDVRLIVREYLEGARDVANAFSHGLDALDLADWQRLLALKTETNSNN
jgi:hypothetical protein